MKTIAHKSKNHAQRGQNVTKAPSYDDDPDCQERIYRIGMNISDINSEDVNRVEHASRVMAMIKSREVAQ